MTETADDLLRELAQRAPLQEFIPKDAFSEDPPPWATWDEMYMFGVRCGACGAWEDVVRPGKTQCNVCAGDPMAAIGIRAKRILENR